MQVLIPMAGEGRRFKEAGFALPKPLIDVDGKPMIERVLDNLGMKGKYVFVVLQKHIEQVMPLLMKTVQPRVYTLHKVTEGAACTCLEAGGCYLNRNEPLLVANCDQIMEWDQQDFRNHVEESKDDGCILTFQSDSPKNSYVELDKDDKVSRVVEKEVISNIATTGIYWWRKAGYMLDSCRKMINAGKRVNGEFYLAPSYNEMIAEGKRIGIYPVQRHWPIGTPEDLEEYLSAKSF